MHQPEKKSTKCIQSETRQKFVCSSVQQVQRADCDISPVVLHGFWFPERLSTNVTKGQGQGIVFVRSLVDEEIVLLCEGSLTEATFVGLDRRSALPTSETSCLCVEGIHGKHPGAERPKRQLGICVRLGWQWVLYRIGSVTPIQSNWQ